MPDTVRRVAYFSIEVPDRPGEGFRILQALVSAGINLLVCSARQAGGRATIEVVPDDTALFKATAATAGLAFTPTKAGFLIQGADRPGALAKHLEQLASAGINVAGIDAMGAGAGRWGAILWVEAADVGGAASALRAR